MDGTLFVSALYHQKPQAARFTFLCGTDINRYSLSWVSKLRPVKVSAVKHAHNKLSRDLNTLSFQTSFYLTCAGASNCRDWTTDHSSIPGRDTDFSLRHCVVTFPGPGVHPTSHPTAISATFETKQRPGHEFANSCPVCSKVKKVWSYTSTLQILTVMCLIKHRGNFAFFFLVN